MMFKGTVTEGCKLVVTLDVEKQALKLSGTFI